MLNRFRWLAIPLVLGLSLVDATAQHKMVPSPKNFPAWFVQPGELGATGWEDTRDDGAGGLAIGESYAGVFQSNMSDKEVLSKIEQWAHSQNWELVQRTGDDKVVAAEFDSEKDPVGAAKRGMAAGHMRSIGVEAVGDHKFSLDLTATSFK
jgi:hypothetical protein